MDTTLFQSLLYAGICIPVNAIQEALEAVRENRDRHIYCDEGYVLSVIRFDADQDQKRILLHSIANDVGAEVRVVVSSGDDGPLLLVFYEGATHQLSKSLFMPRARKRNGIGQSGILDGAHNANPFSGMN